jgi:hypothetical protein
MPSPSLVTLIHRRIAADSKNPERKKALVRIDRELDFRNQVGSRLPLIIATVAAAERLVSRTCPGSAMTFWVDSWIIA